MTLTQFILQIPQEAILGVSRNLWIIVTSIWIVKTVVKYYPSWSKQYHEERMKEIGLQRAVGMKI